MTAQRTTKIPLSDQVVLRVNPQLRAAIEAAADEDRRPMANLIRNILSDWIDGRSSRDERAASA